MTRPNDAAAAGLKKTGPTAPTATPSSGRGYRAIRDIEARADYYDPATYYALTQGPDLESVADPLDEEFIPLTQTRKNSKIFAVGVLPPQVSVTGNLLDRSASLKSILQAPDKIVSLQVEGGFEDVEPYPPTGTGHTSAALALPKQFWVEFVSMCRRLDIDPMAMGAVLYNESRFDSTARNQQGSTDAKGIGQIIRPTAINGLHMDPEVWDRYHELSAREQLPYVEQYLRNTRLKNNPNKSETENATRIYQSWFGGYNNSAFGLGRGYASSQAQATALANLQAEKNRLDAKINSGSSTPQDWKRRGQIIFALRDGFKNPDKQNIAYEQNKLLDRNGDGNIDASDLQHVVANLPPTSVRNLIQEALDSGLSSTGYPRQEDLGEASTDEPTPEWAGEGSPAAGEARSQQERVANTGYNSTKLGEQYTTAQRVEIKQTQAAIETMKNIPPLRMMVNPSSVSVKKEKIISDGNWSRTGPIIQVWGDNQDKISASGQVAGFFAASTQNATGPGLTRTARNFSAGYRNFISLYQLYRNNGGVYLSPSTGGDRTLSLLGGIYLYYDNTLYFGSFDQFTISEEDGKPFTLNYSFEFSVRATFLLDRPQDSGLSYGSEADKYFASERYTIPVQRETEGQQVAIASNYDPISSELRAAEQKKSLADRLANFRRQKAKYDAGSLSYDELEMIRINLGLTEEEAYQ